MKSIVLSFLFATLAGARIPTAPGAELQLAADGYKFTEGPAADAAGNVYFTDQPNDRILKWSVETGKVADFMKPAGRSNGLYFDRDGQLVACADEKSQLWRIDPATKNVTVVLDHYAGKPFNGPNDLWIDPAGGIYFTDPFYKRPYWQNREKPDQEQQRIFYLPKGAKAPFVADDTLVQPNGIIGTPDGKLLFVTAMDSLYTLEMSVAGTRERS